MQIAIMGASGNLGTSTIAALLEEPRVTQIVAIEGIRDGAGTDTPPLASRSKRPRERGLDKRGFGEHGVLSPKP